MHGILTGMFKRYLQNNLPDASFFLFGPRQVGKSTLLKREKPHFTIDLLDPELQLSYNKNPNLLRIGNFLFGEPVTAQKSIFLSVVAQNFYMPSNASLQISPRRATYQG
jgi:predicted AAA+ superfamily ATPase